MKSKLLVGLFLVLLTKFLIFNKIEAHYKLTNDIERLRSELVKLKQKENSSVLNQTNKLLIQEFLEDLQGPEILIKQTEDQQGFLVIIISTHNPVETIEKINQELAAKNIGLKKLIIKVQPEEVEIKLFF